MHEQEATLTPTKERLAQVLFDSQRARQRLVSAFEKSCLEVPETADIALVLGTSYSIYPDKFQKRIYTGTQLQLSGRVDKVLFSGASDHECRTENQSHMGYRMAVENFGLNSSDALTVGGDNTQENIDEARALISSFPGVETVYVVSDSLHLIRALPLARYELDKIGVRAYPLPIPGEEQLDPNDPEVIRETIKAVLYNRSINKTSEPVDPDVRAQIDATADKFVKLTNAMQTTKQNVPFEIWRQTNFS